MSSSKTTSSNSERIAHFLASVIVWAQDRGDPRADRLALTAGDLQVRLRQIDGGAQTLAKAFGYTGSLDGRDDATVAQEVMARSQAALDRAAHTNGFEVDPAQLTAGLGAARRLIGRLATTERTGLLVHIARLQLSSDGGLAPAHLCAPAWAAEDEADR